MMHLLCLVLGLVISSTSAISPSDPACKKFESVDLCPLVKPRDLIFLVDASDSMDPSFFYNAMLDFTEALFCSLKTEETTRGGMITFGREIITQIQLQDWTVSEWFDQVEAVRNDPTSCCSCCTPTAEAFDAARAMLENFPSPNGAIQMVFVISDGDPWQQLGKPAGFYTFPKYSAAYYRFVIVPEQAYKLKNMYGVNNPNKVRITFLGVPNKHKEAPSINYVQGKPTPAWGKGTNQCVTRKRKRSCVNMQSPPFPIVTEPIDQNSFITSSFNISTLLDLTNADLCRDTSLGPTTSPLPAPTNSPTVLPTRSPSLAPTNRPTKKPSTSPTKRPTTGKPSKVPTRTPTNLPTKLPTSQRPSSSPTVKPSKAPSFSAPSFAPSTSPTKKPVFNHLDLFIYLDNSRSMRWRASSCRKADGADPNAPDNLVCWKLFLGFTEMIARKSAEIEYETGKQIGWADSFNDESLGLRVWIYGFACTGGQSIPIVLKIAEAIGNYNDFVNALAAAELSTPDGGTCPGSALQRSVGFIMASNIAKRPYKAGLLFTDGVFYDSPIPQRTAKGLAYFGVLTYALGIAIPLQGNNYGLTPAEIKGQKQQLLAFTDGHEDRVFNFGEDGYGLLNSIAGDFVAKLPIDVANYIPQILARPFWCGFSSNERCLNTNPIVYDTSKVCKWIPKNPDNFEGNGVCKYKDDCDYSTKASCNGDSFCSWVGGQCVYDGPPLVG